jgi:hypothetical protein
MVDKLEIYYTNQAVLRTDQIIKYLLENWSEREVDNFLNALQGFEEIVSKFPQNISPISSSERISKSSNS